MRRAKLDAAAVRATIESTLKRRRWPARRARDIAFHMTDWLDELSRFHAFCRAPDQGAPQDVPPRRVRERVEDAVHLRVVDVCIYNHLVVCYIPDASVSNVSQ